MMSNLVPPQIYKTLKDVVKGNIDNFQVTIHDPNKKGEGFLGDMVFLTLEDKNTGKVLHLVVKQAFTNQNVRDKHPIRSVFVNEIYFYTKVWPRFNRFQKQIPARYQFQKLAECISTGLEENSEKIVLENLKYQNFEVHDKRKPLGKEYYELIFKEYGKLHALSFAYKAIHPEEFAKLAEGLEDIYSVFVNKSEFLKAVTYYYETCLQSLQTGTDDAVIEKLKQYIDDCSKAFLESVDCATKYTVILHGDCWSNNMMFKYDDAGKPSDVRFLDFQLSKEGSPCCDLSYSLYSGADKEVLQEFDYYLRIYHDSLSATLKEFGCDPEELYPFHALKGDWKKYCKLGLSMGLMIWRLKTTNENEVRDLQDITDQGEEEFKAGGYDEDMFKRITRDLFLHLYENDFL